MRATGQRISETQSKHEVEFEGRVLQGRERRELSDSEASERKNKLTQIDSHVFDTENKLRRALEAPDREKREIQKASMQAEAAQAELAGGNRTLALRIEAVKTELRKAQEERDATEAQLKAEEGKVAAESGSKDLNKQVMELAGRKANAIKADELVEKRKMKEGAIKSQQAQNHAMNQIKYKEHDGKDTVRVERATEKEQLLVESVARDKRREEREMNERHTKLEEITQAEAASAKTLREHSQKAEIRNQQKKKLIAEEKDMKDLAKVSEEKQEKHVQHSTQEKERNLKDDEAKISAKEREIKSTDKVDDPEAMAELEALKSRLQKQRKTTERDMAVTGKELKEKRVDAQIMSMKADSELSVMKVQHQSAEVKEHEMVNSQIQAIEAKQERADKVKQDAIERKNKQERDDHERELKSVRGREESRQKKYQGIIDQKQRAAGEASEQARESQDQVKVINDEMRQEITREHKLQLQARNEAHELTRKSDEEMAGVAGKEAAEQSAKLKKKQQLVITEMSKALEKQAEQRQIQQSITVEHQVSSTVMRSLPPTCVASVAMPVAQSCTAAAAMRCCCDCCHVYPTIMHCCH